MAQHLDAIGYLLGVKSDLAWGWFGRVCDLAVASRNGEISDAELDNLENMFWAASTYESTTVDPFEVAEKPIAAPAGGQTRSPQLVTLKQLDKYVNFKGLQPEISLEFDKRITLVFGTNGSGKSSLCDSIKALALPKDNEKTLKNARTSQLADPSFRYRLSTMPQGIEWTERAGFAYYSSLIKVFDSIIATSHVKDAIDPTKLFTELAPFRLEVFEFCRQIVEKVRDRINQRVEARRTAHGELIAKLQVAFGPNADRCKKSITDLKSGAFNGLANELSEYVKPSEDTQDLLTKAKEQLKQIDLTRSEAGTRELNARVSSFRRIQRSLDRLINLCRGADPNEYNKLIASLAEKLAAQRQLASTILPAGVSSERLMIFLQNTTQVFNFPARTGDPCPFCRRPLDESVMDLMHAYHHFLYSELQDQISELIKKTVAFTQAFTEIVQFQLDIDDDTSHILSDDTRHGLLVAVEQVARSIPQPFPANTEIECPHFILFHELEKAAEWCGLHSAEIDEAIRKAKEDINSVQVEYARVFQTVEDLEYTVAFALNVDTIVGTIKVWESVKAMEEVVKITSFPSILAKLTNAGKAAQSELLMAGFESALDKEYRVLTGRSLESFGVRLSVRGERQSVSFSPHVGDEHITRVFSEGEQKVHALAMFFFEAMEQPHNVFVFDDPSTSFDFNYVEGFVDRLVKLIKHYEHNQFIIFTHCWDLFVRLQLAINKSNSDHELDVKVVEHCAIAKTHVEKLDALKKAIETLLGTQKPLEKEEIASLAGMMRRYVEAILNFRVLNDLRQQFKQRRQNVSAFRECTKIVPLQKDEAEALSNFYAKLSVPEHDDYRNNYTTVDIETYREWFAGLQSIEAAVLSRRPA